VSNLVQTQSVNDRILPDGGGTIGGDPVLFRCSLSLRNLSNDVTATSGGHMPNRYRSGAATMLLMALIALFATICSTAESGPGPPPKNETSSDNDSGKGPSVTPAEPTVTVLDYGEVQSILGREVRSATDENMGRIVDIIVDRTGHVRAAVVDFGGFLGVGSRKIAIAWNILRFPANGNKLERVTLEWTRDQVREAPEYKDDKPVGVLEAASNPESLPFQ
jgi:hypothetical protein